MTNRRSCLFLFSAFFYSIIFSTSLHSQYITAYLPAYRMASAEEGTSHEAFDFTEHTTKTEMHSLPERASRFRSAHEYLLRAVSGNIDQINYFNVAPTDEAGLNRGMTKERHFSLLKRLKDVFGYHLFLSVAGSSNDFANFVTEAEKRKIFLTGLLKLYLSGSFDGVDFDWEYPRRKEHIDSYALLIKECREMIVPLGGRVSIAVSRQQNLVKEYFDFADQINFMAYNFPGHHSTLESAVEMVSYLKETYEIPPEKIFLGIPFYGRIHDIKSADYGSPITYRAIVENRRSPKHSSEEGRYSYNDAIVIREKISFVKKEQLGGIMIWEIGQDAYGAHALLPHLNQG